MLDIVRTSLHAVIHTPAGDRFLPFRLPKDIARRMNLMFGEPLCSKDELERRRAGQARLESLKSGVADPAATPSAPVTKLQAPVTVYFEKERNVRLLGRIQEALDAKSIKYTLLDVSGDAGTKAFVMREAKCKEDELPIVFVASSPVGGYNDLVDWDVSGRLEKALNGG